MKRKYHLVVSRKNYASGTTTYVGTYKSFTKLGRLFDIFYWNTHPYATCYGLIFNETKCVDY